MKLRPGKSLGNPLSPFTLPKSLICFIAILSCSGSQLSQFISWTCGSADSKPNDKTAPSLRFSTKHFVISVDGSIFSAIIEGFPLSTCKISNLSSSLAP